MRTPHLVTALLASAAMLGSTNGLTMGADEMRGIITRRGLNSNQRQKRKDRRRAFANGNWRAFR